MPCLALVEPSEPCEIETDGVDEDELPEDDELDVDGAGAGVGAGGGADDWDTGAEALEEAAGGVADATTGVPEEAGAGWWTAGFFAAAW